MTYGAEEFRRVVAEHKRTVFSIAVRITGDAGTAEEVAQDVFLELHRAAVRPVGEDHTRFWLRRVAVHRATDALRRGSRRPERGAAEWSEEMHGGRGPKIEDGRSSAVEWRVDPLLQTLPEPWRVAVALRYGEEMMPEEIAAVLGQPVATVKSHLSRGLKLLRQKAAVTMKEFVR